MRTRARRIEEYIKKMDGESVKGMEYEKALSLGLIQEIYPLNEYLDNIISTVNMDAIRAKGLRVVLDPLYGVSETSLATILHTARCELTVIHDRHDTLFDGRRCGQDWRYRRYGAFPSSQRYPCAALLLSGEVQRMGRAGSAQCRDDSYAGQSSGQVWAEVL